MPKVTSRSSTSLTTENPGPGGRLQPMRYRSNTWTCSRQSVINNVKRIPDLPNGLHSPQDTAHSVVSSVLQLPTPRSTPTSRRGIRSAAKSKGLGALKENLPCVVEGSDSDSQDDLPILLADRHVEDDGNIANPSRQGQNILHELDGNSLAKSYRTPPRAQSEAYRHVQLSDPVPIRYPAWVSLDDTQAENIRDLQELDELVADERYEQFITLFIRRHREALQDENVTASD
ncbi:hypothetical protein CVT24_010018 [Panaeolus cyanescens]|uniref:Uncharacterized protein n=1 Tax=Panaeolus cyanescens TaxID=181874 RepID=A0A409W3U3_9AGAR|nr:hypothetical protein CVT24_010018 [Panaeolus cyanescens]